MKTIHIALAIVFVILLGKQPAFAQVTEQTLKDHVYYLASEGLNGRIAGTKEGRLAADYIAEQFQSTGLTVFSDTTNYYQNFIRSRKFGSPSTLVLGNDTIGVTHINKASHFTEKASFSFVRPEQLDETLKNDSNVCVLIDAVSLDEGIQKIKTHHAANQGVNPYMLLMPDKKRQKSFRINLKSLKKADDAYEVYILTNYLHYAHDKKACDDYLQEIEHLNVLVANSKLFGNLRLSNAGMDEVYDFTEKQDSIVVTNYRNVIAKIEGKQADKAAIVFCAHYDHVDSTYSRKTKGEKLSNYYPGADDNASGTAAVIEIAKSLKEAGYQAEQTIYFCLFDAEELGLYGSRHFARTLGHDVDLVINMDMIGRNKKDRKRCDNIIFAKAKGDTGKAFTKGFDKYCKDKAESLKIRRYDMDFLLLLMGYPSDQASFRPQSNTSVFYTGLHKDYHTHNDTPEKINYKKLTEYVNMMSAYLISQQTKSNEQLTAVNGK
ncbi:M28 family metallopeptidase [Carboxylicivirga sp. RSCT41]|uniref:M28 family metallopeptidase n=1 Tax=Carboxylicivirga agarovorans TaxID=3417570 RepID=UPI003D324EE2